MRTKALSAILLGLAAVTISGCMLAAVGAGAAGTAIYVRGEIQAMEPYDIATAVKATELAVGDLKLAQVSKVSDALTGEIIVRDSEDKKISIKFKAMTEGSTEIRIRVGLWGDQIKSQMVYNAIKDRLANKKK